ncbi:MAG: nitroreductase family protein [Euryarchaeota archaeon]|nr:nitroreductase family protein [Euryarchaeota archaeon]
MIDSEVVRALMRRKSIRKYKPDMPSDEVIGAVVRAGMQAPFASQLYSVVLSKDRKRNAFGAPLQFVVCADCHKLRLFMRERGWGLVSNDLTMLLFAVQDASYMAQNMVIAAESLGMGSCYLGGALGVAAHLKKQLGLPGKVFPFVMLAMGYPAEDPPVRPRYPIDFVLFEGKYPRLGRKEVRRAMEAMDAYYLETGYYRNLNAKIRLEKGRRETFTYDDYTWTEHISRKWGQWHPDIGEQLKQLDACGFNLTEKKRKRNKKNRK